MPWLSNNAKPAPMNGEWQIIVLALLFQAAPFDLAEMPIEDAVTMMFMLLSEDARSEPLHAV